MELHRNDVDFSSSIFFKTLYALLHKHVPLEKLSKRKQEKIQKKPWIIKVILTLIRKRDMFLKKFIKSKNQGPKARYSNLYKQYRNNIVKLWRKSKKSYYTNYFQKHSNNVKQIWKGVNAIISSSKPSTNSSNTLLIEGTITKNSIGIANTFNNFSTTIASKTRQNIPNIPKTFIEYLKCFNITPTDHHEVGDLITLLQDHKGSRPFSIPAKDFKIIKKQTFKAPFIPF